MAFVPTSVSQADGRWYAVISDHTAGTRPNCTKRVAVWACGTVFKDDDGSSVLRGHESKVVGMVRGDNGQLVPAEEIKGFRGYDFD